MSPPNFVFMSLLGARSREGGAGLLNNTGRNTSSYSLGEEWDRLKVVGDWGRYGVRGGGGPGLR